MCEELADVLESTGLAKIDLSIQFSPEWDLPTEMKETDHRSFSLGLRNTELLRAAAKSLRERTEPRPETVIGRIKKLETEGNPADLLKDMSSREVVINWDGGDEGLVRVKVRLSPAEYLAAVEAHASGRFVSVKGDLDQSGRRGLLLNSHSFQVLPN
jgi:hypothetical protein